jgi:ATP-dependent DNA ligase
MRESRTYGSVRGARGNSRPYRKTGGTTRRGDFHHACALGLEGIVSKRRDAPYRSGRWPDWIKVKNADAPAVKRELEEDWSRGGRG